MEPEREAADDPSIALLITSHCGLAPGERADAAAVVQGRLTARRKHGSTLVFLDLMCGEHKMQLVVECDGSEGGHHLAPLGSLVRAAGAPGRSMRGELSLFCRPAAVELLQRATVPVAGPQERPNAPAPRFHVTPSNVRWGRPLGLLHLGACNTLSWTVAKYAIRMSPSVGTGHNGCKSSGITTGMVANGQETKGVGECEN